MTAEFNKKGYEVFVDPLGYSQSSYFSLIDQRIVLSAKDISDPSYIRLAVRNQQDSISAVERALSSSASVEDLQRQIIMYRNDMGHTFPADKINQYWGDLVFEAKYQGITGDLPSYLRAEGISELAQSPAARSLFTSSESALTLAVESKNGFTSLISDPLIVPKENGFFLGSGSGSVDFSIRNLNGREIVEVRELRLGIFLTDDESVSTVKRIASGSTSNLNAQTLVLSIVNNKIMPQLSSLENTARHTKIASSELLSPRYSASPKQIREFIEGASLYRGYGNRLIDLSDYYGTGYVADRYDKLLNIDDLIGK
jgi:hypothetical protein